MREITRWMSKTTPNILFAKEIVEQINRTPARLGRVRERTLRGTSKRTGKPLKETHQCQVVDESLYEGALNEQSGFEYLTLGV